MLKPLVSGASIQPIISVGDTLADGYRYESIADGIAFTPNGNGTVDVFVTHETSLVPFPYTVTGTTATGLSDFNNAQVSRLKLHQNSGGVLSGEIVLDSSMNYQRFCSTFIAGPEHGFQHPILFANEEATDLVSLPPLLAWPASPSNQRQAGLVVALDTKTNKTYELRDMGRHNHENTVVIPGGWDEIIALSGDDTFSAVAAEIDQSLTPASANGSWASSSIVDASAIFGPGTWLVNVQAHTLFVESEIRTVIDTSRTPNVTATLTFKREGGQLLLLTIPGS